MVGIAADPVSSLSAISIGTEVQQELRERNSRIEAEMVRLLFGPSKPVAGTCFSEALVWTLLVGLRSPSGGCSSPW